jgi:3-methylfumaryl-CoA hydratase
VSSQSTTRPDLDYLRQWVGSSVVLLDQVTPAPIAALSATLDREDPAPQPGDPLPPLWHWLYSLAPRRQSEIGADGHPDRGGLLPPKPLPRRMWAGDRLEFHHPLRVGEAISRASTIVDVNCKEGRTGPLVLVLVRHEIRNDRGLALTEEQDIVYRDISRPTDPAPAPKAAPTNHDFAREIRPDPVMLFRYSALTFNSHRIHYDRPYAMGTEGYPGLVVHGPLIATLLVDLLRRNMPDAAVTRVAFRAVSPLFDTSSFSVCGKSESGGKSVKLWAQGAGGSLAMDATAELA